MLAVVAERVPTGTAAAIVAFDVVALGTGIVVVVNPSTGPDRMIGGDFRHLSAHFHMFIIASMKSPRKREVGVCVVSLVVNLGDSLRTSYTQLLPPEIARLQVDQSNDACEQAGLT